MGTATIAAAACGRMRLEPVADRDAPQVTEVLSGAAAPAPVSTLADRPGCTTMSRFQYAEFAVSMSDGETREKVLETLGALASRLENEVPELADDAGARVAAARQVARGELSRQQEMTAADAQDRLTQWFADTCLQAERGPRGTR